MNNNRLFLLPQEILNLIYEFSIDDTHKKEFNKNFITYYGIYKEVKKIYNTPFKINSLSKYRHYLKIFSDDKKYFLRLKTCEDIDYEIDEYLKENLCYIANDIKSYERCLKDKYYIRNIWVNGIKKNIIKEIERLIYMEESEKLFLMLDLCVFKYNYFQFNSSFDILPYEDIVSLEKSPYLLTIEKVT
jgi:hypothetical protein